MDWLNALWELVVLYWPWILNVGLPFVVAAIATCEWSSAAKGWLAIVLSVAVGVIGTLVDGLVLSPEMLMPFFLSMVGVTQIAYRLFKSFGITNRWLEKLLEWRSKVEPQTLNG